MAYPALHSKEVYRLSEDQESLLSDHGETYHIRHVSRRSWSSQYLYSALLMSVLANIAALLLLLHSYNRDPTGTAHTSQHASPISDAIPITYSTTRLNGSFSTESVYRQPASPEVDAAWHDLIGTHVSHIAIPVSKAERYGLYSWQVKLDPSMQDMENTTEPHLIADVEVFHQLHCLNMLRQGSHWDYNYYETRDKAIAANGGEHGPFAGSEEQNRVHFSHCLDMIRQRLMCTADIEVFGQVWLRDSPTIMFGGERKCRNFEDIRSWFVANQIRPNAKGIVEATYVPGHRVFEHRADIP